MPTWFGSLGKGWDRIDKVRMVQKVKHIQIQEKNHKGMP